MCYTIKVQIIEINNYGKIKMHDYNKLLGYIREDFENHLKSLKNQTIREFIFPNVPNKAHVAIGIRRCGKTNFIFQYIKELIKQKIKLSNILYINFEDDRLQPATQKVLVGLLDSFYKLYPENYDKLCYLIFDEIQNVEDWAIVIRRLLDTRNIKIILTGSSAKLLSSEIATSLRGRAMATEIWPYNFHEFKEACKLPHIKIQGQKTLDQSYQQLQKYLITGGFPEVVNLLDADRNKILQDYVDVVVLRDIIERHNISNLIIIKQIIMYLLKNSGCAFSTNKFFNDLKSQGFSVSKQTIYQYLSYIEDAYLIFSVPLYSESIRKINSNPKKVYAIDTGLIKSYTFSRSNNFGHLFENLIYLDLRRKGHKIYYYLTEQRYEIDFITKDLNGKINLYQVVWDINNPETLMREQRALEKAEEELGIKGIMITPETYFTTKF